ncbi:MAG: hypothetical protein M3Z75_17050, partial [Actinomycetota bacterium]|nr:hypothetical protein [Actinomycetota bacterium]
PLAAAARRAAEVAGEAVAHGLAQLGAGEGPVHVLSGCTSADPVFSGRISARDALTGRETTR